MGLTLKELVMWPPEIGDLAKATRAMADTHSNSGDFYRSVATLSTWEGHAADTAMSGILLIAGKHDVTADQLKGAAGAMDKAETDAQGVADKVNKLVAYAHESPGIEINLDTNQVVSPDTSNLTPEAAQEVTRKVSDVEAQILKVLADGSVVDSELAQAISSATGVPNAVVSSPTSLEELLLPGFAKSPLKPGEVRNLGPVAGTRAYPGVDGIKAADLGEPIALPDGRMVMILGDSYANPQVGGPGNTHYPSVAVPVTFDQNGRPHFGAPLTGTNLNSGLSNEMPGPNTLFPLPDAARAAGANNALPAGSVKIGKDTYMMVVGTNTNEGLSPKGSWLVKVTNDPAAGWQPIPDSYKSTAENPKLPTQFSGYQGSDGKVYIAADAFDRSQGVSMYRVDPSLITHRDQWQPYDPSNNTWGAAWQPAITTITPRDQHWGELSFREIEGKAVLSGTNLHNTEPHGAVTVEVHVGQGPTAIGNPDTARTTVVMNNAPGAANNVPAPYGGYIVPGSPLNNLGLIGSQWYQPVDDHNNPLGPVRYDIQDIHVNLESKHR